MNQLNFSVGVHELSPVNAARIQQIVIGLLVAGVLYVTMVIYGQLVAAGVIEEKSNRIVEILLATVRPWQLMVGKIIGIGLIALVQVVLVAAVALVLASATKLVSIPTLGVDVVISGIVWFVLGYLMYALLYAAVGSMVSRQEDVASVAHAGDPRAGRRMDPRAHRRGAVSHRCRDDRPLVHPGLLAGDHAGAHRGRGGAVLAGRRSAWCWSIGTIVLFVGGRWTHLPELGVARRRPREVQRRARPASRQSSGPPSGSV